MIFILLALLNLVPFLVLTPAQTASAQSETFIKVTRFQVPNAARVGDVARLSCAYELGGQSLHAMKLFKDDKEFFRYTPGAASREEQRMAFPVAGINLDRSKSSEREVWLKNVSKNSAGLYKCQVSVEETFNSISAERRMEVLNRTAPVPAAGDQAMFNLGSAGAKGQLMNRQQQQRHTVQQQHHPQQQQQQSTQKTGKTAYGLIPAQPSGGQYQYQASSSSSSGAVANRQIRKLVEANRGFIKHLLQALPTIVQLSVVATISQLQLQRQHQRNRLGIVT